MLCEIKVLWILLGSVDCPRFWLIMAVITDAAGRMGGFWSRRSMALMSFIFSLSCMCRIRLAEQPKLLCWESNVSEPAD